MTKSESKQTLLAKKPGSIAGVVTIPGDKSISQDSLFFRLNKFKTEQSKSRNRACVSRLRN